MHHGHRGLECGGGGGNDRSSAIATLCPRLAARVSSASQVGQKVLQEEPVQMQYLYADNTFFVLLF